MHEFWYGISGVVIGSCLTIFGQWIKHCWETRDARARDQARRAMLRQMLNNPGPTGWRKMSTLSGVIGANRDEAARLLIEVGARASEKDPDKDVWAYVKDKPLPRPKI